MTISGGTVTLTNANIQTSGPLTLTNGTIKAAPTASTSVIKVLALHGGVVTSTSGATLAINGGLTWSGGDIQNASILLDVNSNSLFETPLPVGLNLSSSTVTNKGTVSWSGGPPINAGGSTWTNAAGGKFVVTGAGSFAGSDAKFINQLGGMFQLTHTGQTTFNGPFTNDGGIQITNGGSLRLLGGLTNLSGGTLSGGTYDLTGKVLVPGAVIMENKGNFGFNGSTSGIFDDTTSVNALKFLSINSGTLNIAGSSSFTLNGSLSNSGNITIAPGSNLLPNGAFTQSAGTTAVNGKLSPLGGSPVTINGGRLQGIGVVNANVFNNGGKVAPGNSPGPLTFNGNYVQVGDFEVELYGTTPGFDYDQLIVNGTVTLGGNLLLTRFFDALVGTTFVILANDLADKVTNSFIGLPEGGVINAGGERFGITYKGGDGNDVQLTRLATGVGAIVIGDGKQCSMVNSLTVNFNGLVDLPPNAADAFSLKRKSDGMVVSLSGVTASNSETTTASLGFMGGAMEFKSLADGQYTLILDASMATDPGGELIDGDNNGSVGGNYTNTMIKRFFGDIDCDGDTDTGDFNQFRGSFGGSNFGFDIDGDGDVDTTDFKRFRGNFGGSV